MESSGITQIQHIPYFCVEKTSFLTPIELKSIIYLSPYSFSDTQLGLMARLQLESIGFLTQQIRCIEKAVLPQVKLRPEFEILLTIPCIGNILGLTIMLEVGDIRRFDKVGNYSSYCRCVESKKISNGKKKGENNKKTETAIWPGPMLKRQTMPFDAARKPQIFSTQNGQKRAGTCDKGPSQQTDKSNLLYHAQPGSL